MKTKLIELEDGTLIEVEVSEDEAQQISGSFAEKVSGTIERIEPFLLNACEPILSAWQKLNEKVKVAETEVTLGLSFEGEGNLYLAKSKAGANLTVKLVLRQKD